MGKSMMIRRRRLPLLRAAATGGLAVLLARAGATGAAPVSWDGPATGNWSTGVNWSTNVVPGAAEDVLIKFTAPDAQTVNMDFVYPSSNGISSLLVDGNVNGTTVLAQSAATSLLFVRGNQTIGSTGQGRYSLDGGTNAVGSDLVLGSGTASAGIYQMTGGTLSVSGAARVGAAGTGSLFQSGGSNMIGGSLIVGDGAGSIAGYNLSGAAVLTIGAGGSNQARDEVIGNNGRGSFFQLGGVHNVNFALFVGKNVTGNGNFEIDAGTLNATGGPTYVGFAGTGLLTMFGGTYNGASLSFGALVDSKGTFDVWAGTANVGSTCVGGSAAGAGGSGVVTVQGGTVNAGDLTIYAGGSVSMRGGTINATTLTIANWSALSVTGGKFTLAGGSASASGTLIVGNESSRTGQFVQSGSASVVADGLFVGAAGGGTGLYTLQGGTLRTTVTQIGGGGAATGVFTQNTGVHTTTTLGIGNSFFSGNATYNLVGGSLTTTTTDLQSSNGVTSFNQTGGTQTASVLRLSTLDGTVTYTLSAGRLDAGQISLSATAPEVSPKFTQSGGAARVSGSNGLRIAGTGVYALSAAGTLQVDDSVFVGGNTAGTFNQSGGTATVGVRVAVGDSTGAGTYTLSGGTLTTAQLDIARDTNAAFTLSGGRLEAANVSIHPRGTMTVTGGTVWGNIDNRGTFTATNGAHLGGLTVNLGSTTTLGGAIVLDGTLSDRLGLASTAGLTSLTLNAAGGYVGQGRLLVLVVNHGTIQAHGGSLTLAGPSLDNTGLLANDAGADLFVGPATFTNTGSVTANAGGSVIFEAALANGSTITLNGGVLRAPSVANSAGATIAGVGQMSADVTNAGTIRLDGPTQVFGALTNQPGGLVTIANSQLLVTGAAQNNGTMRALTGGQLVVRQGLTGTPIQAAPPVGADPLPAPARYAGDAQLQAGGALLASYVRQHGLALTGTPGEPASYAKVQIRPKSEGGDTSVLSSLMIASDTQGHLLGKLDLADNALILDYAATSSIASIRQAIASGYAGGTWTGAAGLTSSLAALDSSKALGYAEAAEVGAPATFAGQAVDGSAVLVRYTLAGDANLDGAVDFNDLVRLAQHYNAAAGGGNSWWFNGDFTYDGIVDFNDLVKLAQNYNTALPAGGVHGGTPAFAQDLALALASVPEPSVASAVLLGGLTLARRGRRRTPLRIPTYR